MNNVAAAVYQAVWMLYLVDASTNTWSVNAGAQRSDTNDGADGSGTKALSGELDRIRLTTVGGSNTFDAGSVNIQYQ